MNIWKREKYYIFPQRIKHNENVKDEQTEINELITVFDVLFNNLHASAESHTAAPD